MRKKILIGVLCTIMIFCLTACGKSKDEEAREFFKALEDTVTADSFSIQYVPFIEGTSELIKIQNVSVDGKVYASLEDNCHEKSYLYQNKSLFSSEKKYKYLGNSSKEISNGNKKYYKLFKSLEDKDIDSFMTITHSECELADYQPTYREYKYAIIEILKKYDEDENSISFIKSCNIEDNKFELTMYAYNFLIWCNKNIDSYSIPNNVLKDLQDGKEDLDLTVIIELDNRNTVKRYDFRYVVDELSDGVSMRFSDVNKLDKKADCVKKYNKMIDTLRPGDYKYAAINLIEKREGDKGGESGYRYLLEDDKEHSYRLYVYDADEEEYQSYDYNGYQYAKSYSNDNPSVIAFHTAKDILAYIKDGVALAEVPKWKQVYIDYLSTHKNEIGGCAIGYLNDDDIPEVFICEEECPSHGAGVQIFTVIDGKMKQVGKQEYGSNGMVDIFEKTGIIKSEYVGMGEDSIIYYKMNNNGDADILADMLITEVDMPENSQYFINETEVTKEQWENKEKEIVPSDKSEVFAPAESLTVQETQEAIINWE